MLSHVLVLRSIIPTFVHLLGVAHTVVGIGEAGEEELRMAAVGLVGLEPFKIAVLLVLDEDGGGGGRQELAGVPNVACTIFWLPVALDAGTHVWDGE